MICLAGALTAYLLYDKATEPDRTSPTVTLEQYITARFSIRDDARARVFECSSPHLDAVDRALDEIRALEAKYGIAITASLSDLVTSSQPNGAEIAAHLNVVIPEQNGQDSIQVQKWVFRFVKSGSWRICGADRVS